MPKLEYKETKAEKALRKATGKALKKYRDSYLPYWKICQKSISSAWRKYERDIAPFELICDREIARASRAYTKATQNKGGE